MFKTILGIETSCDETAAAVLEQKKGLIQILSNVISSSAALQEKYGGVLPEQAAREQVKIIIPVVEQVIQDSGFKIQDIDAIAVTYGPGLIGSLLVGIETAKILAKVWDKPLIPVNHLLGHFYANWITVESSGKNLESREKQSGLLTLATSNLPIFPCIGLLVSGGHTDLVLFKDHHNYEYLGGTRDDAAGECFDKCARLLGFSYPGGPHISQLAQKGNPKAFNLPRPMIDSKDFDFSFSGLKTAFANIHANNNPNDLSASLEQAIVDVLVTKTVQAVKKYQVKQVIIAGGVAANQKLINDLRLTINDLRMNIKIQIPESKLCTDNGAMIAARAFFESPINPLKLQATPGLPLSSIP